MGELAVDSLVISFPTAAAVAAGPTEFISLSLHRVLDSIRSPSRASAVPLRKSFTCESLTYECCITSRVARQG